MTDARRLAVVVDLDAEGRVPGGFERGGLDVGYATTAATYLANEGADEIWLRALDAGDRGASVLFDPVRALKGRLLVPLVAWGGVRSGSDARLVLELGADRVVVDCGDTAQDEMVHVVSQIARRVGPDRLTASMAVRRVASAEGFRWVVGQSGHDEIDALDWARDLVRAGAGELAVVSMHQNRPAAHATDLVEALAGVVSEQVVSLGVESELADLAGPLLVGADAVATASLFRTGSQTLAAARRMLLDYGVATRPAQAPYLIA